MIPRTPEEMADVKCIRILTHTAGRDWGNLNEYLLRCICFVLASGEDVRERVKILCLQHEDNRQRISEWKDVGVDIRIDDKLPGTPVKYLIVERDDRTNMIVGWASLREHQKDPHYWGAEQGITTDNLTLIGPYRSRFERDHGSARKP